MIFDIREPEQGHLIFLHYKFGKLKSRGLAAIVLQRASLDAWMHVLVGEEVLFVRKAQATRRGSHTFELCNSKGMYLSAIDSIEVLEPACK